MGEMKKLAEQIVPVEERHSVKISINAKGQWSGEVKCYGQTPNEAMRRALHQAEALASLIKKENYDARVEHPIL